jgi:hypothetical protein
MDRSKQDRESNEKSGKTTHDAAPCMVAGTVSARNAGVGCR